MTVSVVKAELRSAIAYIYISCGEEGDIAQLHTPVVS